MVVHDRQTAIETLEAVEWWLGQIGRAKRWVGKKLRGSRKEKGPNSKISLPKIFRNFFSLIRTKEPHKGELHVLRDAVDPAVLMGAYPHTPGLLERTLVGLGLMCPYIDPGIEVAAFTSYAEARKYLDWSLGPGPREGADPICRRFRSDSLLQGMDRAWVTSMWVKLPLDPPIR